MADRFGFQFPKTMLPERWFLEGSVTVGPNGNVATGPLPIWMASISATGTYANPSGLFTGVWDVTLTDSWNALPYVGANLQAQATGAIGVSGGDFAGGVTNRNNLIVQVIAEDVAVSKHVVLQVTDSTTGLGSAPLPGQKLLLLLVVSNNSSL